jgi:hypothetical protein
MDDRRPVMCISDRSRRPRTRTSSRQRRGGDFLQLQRFQARSCAWLSCGDSKIMSCEPPYPGRLESPSILRLLPSAMSASANGSCPTAMALYLPAWCGNGHDPALTLSFPSLLPKGSRWVRHSNHSSLSYVSPELG